MIQKKNIHVIVATGEWDQDYLRYRRHRLAEYLASNPETEEVIWVCPSITKKPDSFSTLKNGIKQYTIIDLHSNKLFRFGRYFSLFYRGKLTELKCYLTDKEKEFNLCLWFTFPGFPSMLKLANWKRTIYDCSDLWASSISGSKNIVMMLREKSIIQAEARIAENVEQIFCTSDFLNDNLKEQYNLSHQPEVLENGVEYDLFQTQEKPKNLELQGNLVLGFIGGIKPKLDFELMNQVMVEKRNWHLLLVGPDGTNNHPDFQKLTQLPNVTWVGKIPPTEVPQYMNLLDVGILPYKDSVYNNAVFPLKLFEFLGAGKPVVGMNLPSTKKFTEKDVYEYATESNSSTFISLCEAITEVENVKEVIERRKKLAHQKDWNNIFKKMYEYALMQSLSP